jgi:multiple sugar transport system permease protein
MSDASTPGVKQGHHKMTQWEKDQTLWGWIFALPTVIGLLVLNIYPMIRSFMETFYKTGDFGKGNIFVGGANYKAVFTNPEIWQSVLNTFKYAIIEVPISLILGLILAVLLNKDLKGRAAYRAIFFLPMVAAPAAVAMVWRWIFNSKFGLLNNILGLHVNWVSDPRIAWISIGFIGVWSVVGYNMILFLTGLQEIPMDYYEAAAMDGATGIHQFFNITVPLLSPTIFFVLVTRVIGAMQVFDLIYMVMDRTNPALPKTQSIVYLFYKYSFVNNNRGYGSTIVMLLLLIVMIMTVIQMKLQKKWVFYY